MSLAGLGLGCPLTAPASEDPQAYPSRLIHLVVPFSPGGPTDVLARALAVRLAARLHQPVIVDNRAGAASLIGTRAVAEAPPDGHTLLVSIDSSLAFAPAVRPGAGSPGLLAELRVVSTLASFSQMLVVAPGSGLSSFTVFAEACRQGLSYASSGHGTPGHLAMEVLTREMGARMIHVPYRGAVPALVDLLGGHVQCAFLPTPLVLGYLSQGKLRALALSGSRRSRLAPEVPTVAELGYPQALTEPTFLMLVPAATPGRVVRRLNLESRKALSAPDLQARMLRMDMQPAWMEPQESQMFLRAGAARWSEVARRMLEHPTPRMSPGPIRR